MFQVSKQNKDKMNPFSFSLIKGFEPDPPKEPDTRKINYRPSKYEFVVDWQLNERLPDDKLQ